MAEEAANRVARPVDVEGAGHHEKGVYGKEGTIAFTCLDLGGLDLEDPVYATVFRGDRPGDRHILS